MNWWAFFVVALAAPVWSHSHHHKHMHKHKRACEGASTVMTTLTIYATQEPGVSTAQDPQTTASVVVGNNHAVEAVYYATGTSYAVGATSTAQSAQPTQTAGSTSTGPGRAIWLWESDIIKDDAEVEQFLSFAASNNIKTAYALIDRDMGFAVFETFIEKCKTNGITVEALMGNSQWVLGAGEPSLESQLKWLDQYQGNASANAKFSGIHMDIEPWGLDGWESNKESYTSAFQSIVSEITTLGTSLGLPVAADLPYWAESIKCPTTGKTLDVWMLDNLDSATFMTYRNTPSELLDIATAVLEAGDAVGKPVWLAVETVDAADAILISYFGKTFSALSNDLVTVNTEAASHASFAGIAIHDYTGVKALSS